MQSLSHELKTVISRRLERAGPHELLTIASALCATEPETVAIAPAAAPRFDVYVGSNTVLDNSTGLIWTRGNVGSGRLSWQDANAACAALELDGHSGWRLPTIRELLSLVDYERHDPAIDDDVFECESSWYWTSTPAAPSPGDCAWVVYFNDGYAGGEDPDFDGFVRAVRAGQ